MARAGHQVGADRAAARLLLRALALRRTTPFALGAGLVAGAAMECAGAGVDARPAALELLRRAGADASFACAGRVGIGATTTTATAAATRAGSCIEVPHLRVATHERERDQKQSFPCEHTPYIPSKRKNRL